jgi:hypothetical protein
MIPNFVNLLLCFAFGWSAMCRLAMMHHAVNTRTALLYLALFVGSVLSGLQYFFVGTLATWWDVAASAFVCVLLLVTVPQWRYGPPNRVCCAS